MSWQRRVLLVGGVLAVLALLVPEELLARGGGGRRGGGRGKKGRGGEVLDRKGLVQESEEEMRNADRDLRLQTGRRGHLDSLLEEQRREVLVRNRHRGEDARRDLDARREVAR